MINKEVLMLLRKKYVKKRKKNKGKAPCSKKNINVLHPETDS